MGVRKHGNQFNLSYFFILNHYLFTSLPMGGGRASVIWSGQDFNQLKIKKVKGGSCRSEMQVLASSGPKILTWGNQR